MSQTVIQLFKEWMIADGKSPNTASNYMTGVNTVSAHCGCDLFDIVDVSELEKLYRAYGPKGEFAAIGASNSSNVHNGLKQWLAYQKYRAAEPSIDPLIGHQQWDAFLARWPVSKLRELTLEHYYGTEGDDTFYSWMRDHTNKLGDFREGLMSAGVRPRSPNAKNEPSSDMQTDGQYLWYRILGDSAQKAFDNLMAELMTAVDAVQQGNLSLMDGLKNAPGSLVWKVAFLYQDRARPLLLPFYNQKQLKRILGADVTGSTRELQQQLMARRGDKDVLEFSAELERQARERTGRQEQKMESRMKTTNVPLNQILFGPPGTGKTYETINAALEILDPQYLATNTNSRTALKARFDELVSDGHIRFVTFHQSFSYEDFVEGLRAETDGDSGQLRYEVVDGVFKSLCELAAAKVTQQAEAPVDIGKRRVWKMSLGNTLGSDASIFEECLKGNYVLLGYGGNIDFSGCISRSDIQQRFTDAGVELDGPTDYSLTSVSAFVIKMKPGDLLVVSDGNFKFRAIGEITGDYVFKPHSEYEADYSQMRPVKWLRQYSPSLPHTELLEGQFSQMTLYELRSPTLNKEKLQALLGAPIKSTGALFQVGQRFGQGYVVRSVGPDVVEFDKPRGGVLPLPLSLVRQLLAYVRAGQLDVEDIRQGRVFEKVAEAELEKYMVNGYQALLATLVESLLQPQSLVTTPDARVLIIDEINRGNVSRIFGELITLIEPSKRAGASEALEVVLPYSKKPLSVPDNLYLIGTMNTADRSLAGLDLALRRRFTFREMPPKPELLNGVTVEGINIGQLLAIMNERIEVLLDRDHRIGHAYFMELEDVDKRNLPQLAAIFREKILPLLQEYFFEDWQRIQWVLNDHRKAASDCFVYQRRLNTSFLFGAGVDVPTHNQPWCINEEAYERPEAYRGIIDAESLSQEKPTEEAEYGGCTIKRLASGSIQVWRAGACEPVTKPVLRDLAAQLNVKLTNGHDAPLNTRQLGARVLAAIAEQQA